MLPFAFIEKGCDGMPDAAATESMTGSELAWMPPPYAEPGRFSEHEVTVGTGPLAVSGTLSVPRGQAPGPGVVLLAGGGPFDRDETSGPNKPLKDLAWGSPAAGRQCCASTRRPTPTAMWPRHQT